MNMFGISRYLPVTLILLLFPGCAAKQSAPLQQYTFTRSHLAGSAQSPRGGTTKGLPVTLDKQASEPWQALQEAGISKLEQDRRAILAMTGDYKTTFEFIETISFLPDESYDRPYVSWATEQIFPIKVEPHFISLQHVMVMYFMREENVVGPVVIKHWRQDWTYEPTAYHEYVGNGTWQLRRPSKEERQAAWVQEVFHVDDSPRYAALGRWSHNPQFSEWTGHRSYRPLPRREYSVRSDYDVLDAVNRHIVLSTGWIHEQENLKKVLEEDGSYRFVARELGFNRYQRIVNQDFSAGIDYWEKSKAYWQEVRHVWDSLFEGSEKLTVVGTIEGKSLIEKQFGFVDTLSANSDPDSFRETAQKLILPHVSQTERASKEAY